jgi:hypothetical protein
MAHKIGTYTLPVTPDAETYEVSLVQLAGMVRALDGSGVTHYLAAKKRWTGTWQGLTSSQRNSIMTQLLTQADISWYPWEEDTTQYTVRVLSASWTATPGAPGYSDVHFELEQV